jgi:hypothetical protein
MTQDQPPPDPITSIPAPDDIRERLAALARERDLLRQLLPLSERAASLAADRRKEAAHAAS